MGTCTIWNSNFLHLKHKVCFCDLFLNFKLFDILASSLHHTYVYLILFAKLQWVWSYSKYLANSPWPKWYNFHCLFTLLVIRYWDNLVDICSEVWYLRHLDTNSFQTNWRFCRMWIVLQVYQEEPDYCLI